MLAAALERGHVVDGDHRRARAVQHRAIHPGRVEDIRVARTERSERSQRLEQLVARRRGLAQRPQHAARVAPNAVWIGDGAAVEDDLHRTFLAITPSPIAACPQHNRFAQSWIGMTASLHVRTGSNRSNGCPWARATRAGSTARRGPPRPAGSSLDGHARPRVSRGALAGSAARAAAAGLRPAQPLPAWARHARGSSPGRRLWRGTLLSLI